MKGIILEFTNEKSHYCLPSYFRKYYYVIHQKNIKSMISVFEMFQKGHSYRYQSFNNNKFILIVLKFPLHTPSTHFSGWKIKHYSFIQTTIYIYKIAVKFSFQILDYEHFMVPNVYKKKRKKKKERRETMNSANIIKNMKTLKKKKIK